jgi:hypothetical protein
MITFGILALVGAILLYLGHRLNESQTWRNLAGVGHRMPLDSDTGARRYCMAEAVDRDVHNSNSPSSGAMWFEGSDYDPYLLPAEQTQRLLRAQPQVILEGQFRDYPYGVDTMKGKRTTRTTGRQKITHYKRIAAGSATATAGPIEIETRQPNRKPDTQADVAVPAMQALISATIAALVVGVLGLIAERTDVLRLAGVAFFVVVLAGRVAMASWSLRQVTRDCRANNADRS